MPASDYTVRETEAALIVTVDVDNLLSVIEVNRIGSGLTELLKNNPRNVVLDLTRIRYAGSAALGMLLRMSKSLQDTPKRLILTGTHHLDTLFKVSRTVAVFDVAKDVDSALQSIPK